MEKKRKQDLVLGVALMAFGIFVMITAKDYGPIEMIDYTISPSFVPFFLGLLIVVLSGLLMIHSGMGLVRLSKAAAEAPAEQAETEKHGGEKKDLRNLMVLAAAIVLIFAYALLLLPKLGFVVSTIVFLAAFMCLLGTRSLLRLALVSVIGTGIFYVLFSMVFHIPLPVFSLF